MSFARVGAADHRDRRNREEGTRAAGRCRPQTVADNRFRLAALLMLTGTRRTVLMLASCQALSMTGGSIVGLTGAIVGNMLTPDKALSTLPIAVQQAGVMAATIPAALLMARIGRRPGFWLGTAIGGVGAVIATWAIFRSSFEWFCFGTFLLGANRGATQQYRFAAAEIADEAFRSKAISLVLAGGVVSAVFGAEVAKWSRDLFEPVLFAGCYALILVLFLASAVLLYFVELPRPATPVLAGGGRPLREIAMEPSFIAAAVAGMIAYGVMSLVMTATPIAMLDCGHEFPLLLLSSSGTRSACSLRALSPAT